MEFKKLSIVREQMTRFLDIVFRVNICMYITGSVQLLRKRCFRHPWWSIPIVVSISSGPAAVAIWTIIASITAPIIVSVITSISVACCTDIGVAQGFIPTIYPLFVTVTSKTRVVSVLMFVLFIVTSWAVLPYMVFVISRTVGNFHEFGYSIRLLST
jgi:hypothetical protein